MKHTLIFFILIALTTTLFSQTDQLIVWKNEAKPVLKIKDMEKLQELATDSNLELIFKDVNNGAPEEVTFTPMISFQNELGRSIYYGRYQNISRLRNFVRTAGLAHQQSTDNFKSKILVWKEGRTTVTAPLKLTELKGTIPKKYNEQEFIEKAKQQVVAGMTKFVLLEELNQTKTTRSFYFNLYPHVDEKCNFTVSAEIFCQFNCVKPVYQKYAPAIVEGKWKNRNKLFAEAGKLIEENIFRLIKESDNGDAFQTIPNSIPVKSWEALDLTLPVLVNSSENENAVIEIIPQKWVVDLPKDINQPFCIFSFLPPVDTYAGEVKNMTGTFTLKNENQLSSATGLFEVRIENVTMGAEDFDAEVQNKMLNKTDFPTSTFSFDTFDLKDQIMEVGKPIPFNAKGTFNLMGRSVQLFVPGQIVPIRNKNGDLRMQVNASFNLPLFESFRVEGPDGPSPAKDTLQFFMKFNLKPI